MQYYLSRKQDMIDTKAVIMYNIEKEAVCHQYF